MTLVSVVFSKNFVSVVSDGLAKDGEGNVISTNFKKFRVYNDEFIVAVAGSSIVFDRIFDDVEKALQDSDVDDVMRNLAVQVSQFDKIVAPYMTVIMLNLSKDGFYGIIQKAGDELASLVKPIEGQYNYWIVAPNGADDKLVGKKLIDYINKSNEITPKSIRLGQIKLNNYISANFPDSVNRNTMQYQHLL